MARVVKRERFFITELRVSYQADINVGSQGAIRTSCLSCDYWIATALVVCKVLYCRRWCRIGDPRRLWRAVEGHSLIPRAENTPFPLLLVSCMVYGNTAMVQYGWYFETQIEIKLSSTWCRLFLRLFQHLSCTWRRRL